MMPLPDAEIEARYRFTMDLYELQQLGYHAQVQAGLVEDEAQEAVDSLKALAEVTSDTSDEDVPPHIAVADSLLGEIEDVAAELRRRNSDLRGWWRGLIGEFDGGPSVIGSMTGPNDSQAQRLVWTQHAFQEAVVDLDAAIQDLVPALNRLVEEREVPSVEVPERGSGVG
jgi:hypothetical protein